MGNRAFVWAKGQNSTPSRLEIKRAKLPPPTVSDGIEGSWAAREDWADSRMARRVKHCVTSGRQRTLPVTRPTYHPGVGRGPYAPLYKICHRQWAQLVRQSVYGHRPAPG